MQPSDPCQCNLCVKEEKWELEHGTCYRCSHGIPCQTVQDTGRECCTILEAFAAI